MAPDVLLVPGLGGRAAFWDRQGAALAGRFRPFACDLRGRDTVEALARDVLDELDARGVARCHVVGHSTGGAIAQVIAQEHPERVERLVLSATWCAPTTPFAALFRLRKRILAELGAAAFAVHGALLGWPDPWLEAHPELLSGADPGEAAALAARLDAILAFDRSAHLGRIRAPTLVVCAADDAVVPLGHSRRIAAGIRGATLRVLPDGGHFPQVTRTDAYNSLLIEFLEQADG
ncbi:MAG TPA: alpha/beta hydrolase [Burkholderiales bacterium]|nr:alpha/beta hydrolase [Burkholderiales bacterium]